MTFHDLFRRTSPAIIREYEREHSALPRSLSLPAIVLFGLGTIIGVGIFVVTGIAAAKYAGPALVLSFVIAGITAILVGLCYAEFAAMAPIAGSAYSYSYITIGEFAAWIIGWDLILEYVLLISEVAIGWSAYAADFLKLAGADLPPAFTSAPADGGLVNLPAVLLVCSVGILTWWGLKESVQATTAAIVVKGLVLGIFLVIGIPHINPANWSPFMPFGISGIMLGAAITFNAFLGFDAISTAAEETKDPQRTVPLGIILSVSIAIVLYILVTLTLTGIMPYYEYSSTAAPAVYALGYAGAHFGEALISAGLVGGLLAGIIVVYYGATRILFAISRDGLLPPVFMRISPRTQTPAMSILLIGVVASLIAGFVPITYIVELVNIGTLVAFTIVAVSVIILRSTRPEIPRPFRCPLVPFVPLVAIALCGYLIVVLPFITHVRFVVWMALGCIIYFLYSRKHSRIGRAGAEG
ncbi:MULTISPECIES: amino acid permease [unclassified Methanoregula]|uniref:amino acid permease n=1 Tax=unclassified Methanoregula TaxID=2649730 RepID=UPI0009C58BC1|nr:MULTISPECIES: amino acid permease [unclassified Methanoregula]OPX63187.1 MAG: putative fructoselysine transporter [Methanoregula sp. PtaB.Bin085]OPY33487.1 MAG: putative fructoselysine transporter [Methanoregula sp. PtaU1.Bin006]